MKNGDRWTVCKVPRSGGLTVRHSRNGRTVRLPAAYVAESVELGYATTVHTAQGITADTMHGKILYPAVSNWAAWQIATALGISA